MDINTEGNNRTQTNAEIERKKNQKEKLTRERYRQTQKCKEKE